ncbi:hypothetical protein ACOJR9_16640 [Alteromonas sp. A081]|uniref:hypothetical protein n=1 Tax=Alteromonas sp. A081 TaxID=3410269 RepID=UPI003B985702
MSNFLIWVGAGETQSLNFNYEDYRKVIFIDPLLRVSPPSVTDNSEKFVFLTKGVVPCDFISQPFSIFNNDEFSSFEDPTALKHLYPNLTIEEVRDIETITALDIVRQNNVLGNENTLVLDVPCMSAALLEDLKNNDLLRLFNTLVVTTGQQALYSNSNDINYVTKLLNDEFYEFVEDFSDDNDLLTQKFDFNSALKKTAVLENEILDLNAQLKLVAEANQKSESDKDELKLLLSNSQIAFREVQDELQTVEEKANSYDAQINVLANEKDSLELQLSESNKKAKGYKAQLDLQETQLQSEQQKSHELKERLELQSISEEANSKKIASLETDLKAAGEKAESQMAQLDLLENQLQSEQQNSHELKEKLELQCISEEANNKKIASLETDLKAASENAEATAQQLGELRSAKEVSEAQSQKANKKAEEYKAQISLLENQLKGEQQKSRELTEKLEFQNISEEANNKKIVTLEADLKAASEKAESQMAQLDLLETQLQSEQQKSHELKERLELQSISEEANSEKIASLESELSAAKENAAQKVEKFSLENERLTSELGEEKAKTIKAHEIYEKVAASEQTLKSALNELEVKHKDSVQSYRDQIDDLKAKFKESEDKQKETYEWFASRKQQVETLTVQLEALKRENKLLATNNETALAVSELEQRLTAMLNKQNDDSIEIANALGKHVTRCHEEQKSNIASQFELRKLSALSRLPIGSDPHSMDASNLAELSSLVIQNKYDVILEFGSGLSTVVAASALSDKAAQSSSNKYLLDKNNISDIENSLPKHIASFEQSSEYFEKTRGLLVSAGVDAYVDLVLAPMVSVSSLEGNLNSDLFYDCSEKLLELKRLLSAKSANILVIVDGPSGNDGGESARYWALPMVLDYLSPFKFTFFVNNSKDSEGELPQKWRDECSRRQLTLNIKQLNTPKGISLLNIQP